MFGRHAVLADSNVLYSRTLRDWLALLHLEREEPLFVVLWTEDIVTEAMYHLRRNHPRWSGSTTARIRCRITQTFEGGRVADFEIDDSFAGRDPHDAHVHAAAMAGGADILLTSNAKDFLPVSCDGDVLPYEVYAPDAFFVLVDDSDPRLVEAVTRKQAAHHGERQALGESLRAAGAPCFAARVEAHLRRIALTG